MALRGRISRRFLKHELPFIGVFLGGIHTSILLTSRIPVV